MLGYPDIFSEKIDHLAAEIIFIKLYQKKLLSYCFENVLFQSSFFLDCEFASVFLKNEVL